MSSATPLTLDSVVVAAQGQISNKIQNETVVLDLQRGEYHGLEGVGPRIWEIIQTPQKISAVRDVILSEYDVSAAECEKDLLGVLTDMQSRGLIEVSAG